MDETAPIAQASSVPSAVLVVGECLVDMAPLPSDSGDDLYAARFGGGPANVAIGLARLGVKTAFAGRFAGTGFGPRLRRHLVDNSVDLTFSVEAHEPATLAVVTLDTGGQASYTFYGPGTADWQWGDDELPDAAGPSMAASGISAVHTGSLATAFAPGAVVLERWLALLRQRGEVVVSFDPNVRPGVVTDTGAYVRRLDQMAASAHIVKASEEDIEAAYPGVAPLSVAERWVSRGTSLALVTEGEKGATAVHRNGTHLRLEPPPVMVSDTIGAGDSFTSGLLAYLACRRLLTPAAVAVLDRATLEEALAQAVMTSAFTCTRPGSDPPTSAELETFRHRTGPSA